MQDHAAAHMVPVVASNRVGTEQGKDSEITFYGASFIIGFTGEILVEADRTSHTHITHTVDLDAAAAYRDPCGVFRDRRPEA